MSDTATLTRRQARRNGWFAYVGSAVALTGVQMISPAMPVMRDALGLTETQLGLVMSVYLLPGALAALPAGLLADRIGRRLVLGGAYIGFGICGAVLPAVGGDFNLFLAVRFVQGLMFAGLLPLTMTIIGDSFNGAELVAAQGRRSVAMSSGDGLLPVLGGLLVAGGWFVPWLGQLIAIPFGIAVLVGLVDPPSLRATERTRLGLRDWVGLFAGRSVVALQYMGVLRLFMKFAALTFLPVFLVDVRDATPALAGFVLGVAALSGTIVALLSGRLARVARPTTWIAVGVGLQAVGVISMVAAPWTAVIFVGAVLFGAGDGTGTFTNALVTSVTDAEHRASFSAATVALRNLAKFAAPVVFGIAVTAAPISRAFMAMGAIAACSVFAALLLRPIEHRLGGEPSPSSPV